VHQISERMVDFGHEVVIATSKNNNRKYITSSKLSIEEFELSGNYALGIKGFFEEQKRYQSFLLNSSADIIVNFAAQQWATDLMLPILEKIKSKKVLVPTGFSALHDERYGGYFNKMKEWLKIYDLNIFLSDNYQDINFARSWGVNNIKVIPNGASEEEFLSHSVYDLRRKLKINKDVFLILLVGSHTGLKGHKEAIKIFSRANISNAALLIVGNFNGGWKRGRWCLISCGIKERFGNFFFKFLAKDKKIIVADLSREQTVAAYKQSNLFLFPSNIECSPIVLFESMAAHLPFLSSAVGNAEEIISWSGGGGILPTKKKTGGYCLIDVNGSARLLESIYRNETLRNNLAKSGYNAWRSMFTWNKIAKNYEEEYKKLLIK